MDSIRKKNLNKELPLKVLHIDEMGRVVTSGQKGFDYGILYPQNVTVNSATIPITHSIGYIKERIFIGSHLRASVIDSIEDQQGLLFAILTIDITAPIELARLYRSLREGTIYDVVINEISIDSYLFSFQNGLFTGYIERKALENDMAIGDRLQLRLERKGENIFQYAHFVVVNNDADFHTLSPSRLNDKDVLSAYEQMFLPIERRLLGEHKDVGYQDTDEILVQNILKRYPNTNRNNAFLEDLQSLYCRYDARLEVVISNFMKYKSTDSAPYWIKFYRNEKERIENLLLFNSNDIVIRISLERNILVVKELYYNRTNVAAQKLLEEHCDACLILDADKLIILNKYQSAPLGFSANDAIDYIVDMQNFHGGILKDLKSALTEYRQNDNTDFSILKGFLSFDQEKSKREIGDVIYISNDSDIQRTTAQFYRSGIAFNFILPHFEYARLVNGESDGHNYVALTDENGKPLRSGLLNYDYDTLKARIEFPNDNNREIDSGIIRKGFYLKLRNATEHYQVQIDAIADFVKNKGTSFYDEMMTASLPEPIITDEIDNITFYDSKLINAASDSNQPLAVKKALGNQKVVLIQGPPGTGKTTVIIEIIRQLVKQGKKVLVCSQTHAAVDNIVEKIKSIPSKEQEILSILIGNEGEEESWGEGFNSYDYRLFLENNKQLIQCLQRGGNDKELEEIKSKFNYSVSVEKKYKAAHEYIIQYFSESLALYKDAHSIIDKIINEAENFSSNLLEAFRYQSMDVILGTCIGIGMNRVLKRGFIKFDTVIIDEAAKANLAESIVPLRLGERFVLVGDDKQLPPYSDTNLIEEYLKQRQENIFDKQDLLKAVTTSLFQKLHESDGFSSKCLTMLNYQYRMHPDIGSMISEVFYNGTVNMGASTHMQQLFLPTPYDQQVVFIDTNRGDRKNGGYGPYERFTNNSYCNDLEAEIICDQIIPTLQKNININDVSIGIITPYSSQRELLRSNIRDFNFKRCVYTIDAIQGKEFDIVVFSFVRAIPPSRSQTVGFLDDMRRLNVSLSRAKKKLILIGHKQTLVDVNRHDEDNILGVKPHEVFTKLSQSSITFTQPSKADIFSEKYQVGDIIPCIIDSVENNKVFIRFKDDPIFCYPIPFDYARKVLEGCQGLNVKFVSYNDSKKPLFNIVSIITPSGKQIELPNLSTYKEQYPLGTIVRVFYKGKDENGEIKVSHLGVPGKIQRNSYPIGYFDDLNEGDLFRARVYSINNSIRFCPIFDENIVPYIHDGEIKNFYCKVVDKPSFPYVKVEFDAGFSETLKISPFWYNYLSIGEGYTIIGYSVSGASLFIYKDGIFNEFRNKYNEGDCVIGKLIYVGKQSIAVVDNYPGYIVNSNTNMLLKGDVCRLIVSSIDEDNMIVNFTLA